MKELRILSSQITDLSDLVKVLNYIKKRETNCEENLFTDEVLDSYANPSKKSARRYKVFYIPKKKKGKLREISAPTRNLKEILYYINILLSEVYQPGCSAMGFVKGRSIVDNAQIHVGQNYVFNLDLTDFFTSISQSRVSKRLQVAPFNFKEEVANTIAGLCCIKTVQKGKSRHVLPQGAPTSPLLTNAVCDFLDRKLRRLARKNGLNYSRYADDMTFSSMHNVYQKDSKFIERLFSIIAEENFSVNPDKTRLQKRGERQEVTGLTVNDKVNTAHKYTREIRNILYIWKQYGYKDAYSCFYKHYKTTKGHVKKGEPVMENVIIGKLDFLKMVKGDNDPVYQNLLSRFEQLNPSIYDSTSDKSKVSYIQSYSVPEFEEAFGTKVKLILLSDEKLNVVYKTGKKENTIYLSSSARDIILEEKAKRRKNYRFVTKSLSKMYVTLCRSNNINYWMLIPNDTQQDHTVHPKYNNLPIDQLLDEWEKNGLEYAAETLSKILNGEADIPETKETEVDLPELGKKKKKKGKSSSKTQLIKKMNLFLEDLDFDINSLDPDAGAEFDVDIDIDSLDPDNMIIEQNTEFLLKLMRNNDGKDQ